MREFTTSKLDNGAEWKDYTVKVVSNVDGREESKEQTITLTGGEDRDLSFDFNSNPIAQHRRGHPISGSPSVIILDEMHQSPRLRTVSRAEAFFVWQVLFVT